MAQAEFENVFLILGPAFQQLETSLAERDASAIQKASLDLHEALAALNGRMPTTDDERLLAMNADLALQRVEKILAERIASKDDSQLRRKSRAMMGRVGYYQ